MEQENAVKLTQPHTRVALQALAAADRIRIGVEDECGGLPDGRPEESSDRSRSSARSERASVQDWPSAVAANGAKLHVRDLPRTGCVFTIDLPLGDAPKKR